MLAFRLMQRIAEAGLSYLGLGAQPPNPSWGNMLRRAYDLALFTHPWQLLVPGGALPGVVAGVARGCRENGCVLLGGETAEMPSFYATGEYDIAGFIVGVVERAHVIDGSRIMVGDTVLALPSVGLHTNGYSLARKLFFEVAGYKIDKHLDELDMTVSAALLAPHPSYLDVLEGIIDQGVIKGLAHITGGGLLENIPRILPEGINVEIARGSWPMLPIFSLMQGLGQVSEEEMYRTFNMGIGMIIICASSAVSSIKALIAARGTICFEVGRVVSGTREVKLI